jgi:hypothetical protein
MRSHGFLSVRRDPDAGKAEVPRFAQVEKHSGGAAISTRVLRLRILTVKNSTNRHAARSPARAITAGSSPSCF